MKNHKRETVHLIAATAGILFILLCIWVGGSYMEARAFNHVTGKNVSTLDAMFIRLRVQEGSKE